ncbi:MAG: alpha/beta hydrolase [Chloroflexales bacterium]|nr:alpha/beta hydrolase [Chloroflexales bacterium]
MDLNEHRVELKVAGTSPVRLSVVDIGPTESPSRGTIVCLHGAAGTADQWSAQIEHLAPNYRIIAPDLRGHGKSEIPSSAYSLEEFLWDFTQLLSLLKVEEPFILMSHSFGGPIALTFAAAQPQRLSKLVLIATAPEMHIHPLHEFIVKLPIHLGYLERLRPIVMPKTYAPAFVIQRVLAGTLFRWRGYDLLPAIRIPTLVVAGQWDFIVPLAMAQKTHELLLNSRLEVIRYTRHLPHLERPAAVNRILDRFLLGRTSWREASIPAPSEGKALNDE